MAVGYISSGTSAGSGFSLIIGATTFTALAGDTVFVCVNANGTTTMSTSASSSATWTQLGTTQSWASSTRSTAVFYRRWTGTESGNAFVASFGTSVAANAVRAVHRGVDSTSPINDYAFTTESDASDNSVPLSALTTTATSRVIGFGLTPTQALTAPTNFISRSSSASNGNTNAVDIGPDYAAGSLGPWSFALGAADQHAAWSIALKEDPARREPAWESTAANVTSTSGATSITPSAVLPIQTGDLLIEEIELSSSSVAINSVPSGWTLIDSTFSGQCRLYTYQKIYDGSIGSFGFSATVVARAAGSRFTSPHPTTPIDSNSENSGLAGTTVTFPAVTPTGNGLLAYLGASASTASQANAATTPTNATERYDASTASASGSVHTFGGTNGNASAGVATSTFTSTLTNSADWAAQTIVLANLPTPPAAPTGLTALVTQS